MSENSYESEPVDSDDSFSSKGFWIVFLLKVGEFFLNVLLVAPFYYGDIFMLLVTYLHTVSEMRPIRDIRN